MTNDHIAEQNLEEPKTKATTGDNNPNPDDDITDSFEPASSEDQAETLDGNTPRDEKTSEDEDILFIEQKYCTVCNLEQPLRTKHC